MAETPQFVRGPAQPGQLPMGEATDLNEGMQAAAELGKANAQNTPPPSPLPSQDPRHAPVAPNPPQPLASSPQNDFLFGPTKRPNEPLSAGLNRGRLIPPPQAANWMVHLGQMAADPRTPPQVRALYALLVEATRGQ
jgi:hypothetical protein